MAELAEIIDGRQIFAAAQTPASTGEVFVSGEVVEPGTYRDVRTGTLLHLLHADSLPEEVRIVRYPRRFQRLSEAEATQIQKMA